MRYDSVDISLRQAEDKFANGAKDLNFTLGEFWQWAYSDLITNKQRAVLGEFLVARALGIANEPRKDWEPWDLMFQGLKIEVKTSGYLQLWQQEKLSASSFDVEPKRIWNDQSSKFESVAARHSDVFVFCLHSHRDKKTIEPTDISQWEFWITETSELDRRLGNQKTLALSRLSEFSHKIQWEEISNELRKLTGKRG